MEIRVTDPMTLKAKIKEAKKLQREGHKVVIVVDNELFKVHDADTVAEWLGKVPLEVDCGS